ncbi:unknown [Clostridium sp. CAG:354]|nr:unknown [Clostridium sp. CAG:354]HIT23096.1 hypothetical protein [Candidatus Faecimonas intestinavium]
MNIKIGKFNFINNRENRIFLSGYDIDKKLFNYFYLDGKADTLYVSSRDNFDKINDFKYNNYSEFDLERKLSQNFLVLDYNMEIKNAVNRFINDKARQIYRTESYSRYKLYKDISLGEIFSVDKNSKFSLGNTYDSYIDVEDNKIIVDGIKLDPYTQVISNLEDFYKNGRFNHEIKATLIKLELQDNIAPKFVSTLIEINNFLQNKNSVNILFKNCEKAKIEPRFRLFLYFGHNNIELSLSEKVYNSLKKLNSNIDINNLKLEDLQGLSYGKELLNIEPKNLENIINQIVISPKDKLFYRLDVLEKNINEDYSKIYNENVNLNLPINLKTIKKLEELESIAYGTGIKEIDNKISDLSKKLYDIDIIRNTDNVEEFNSAIKDLNDYELNSIANIKSYITSNEESEETEEDEI